MTGRRSAGLRRTAGHRPPDIAEFHDVKANVERLLDGFKFREALKEAMNLARIGNKYIADCEPWKVAKTDMARVETILNISLQLVANLAIASSRSCLLAAHASGRCSTSTRSTGTSSAL